MVRNLFLTSHFSLFHGVVKEKVYQNSVYLRSGMVAEDFSADELYTPYTAACYRISIIHCKIEEFDTPLN